jgi:UDP-glucose 4-epimerase
VIESGCDGKTVLVAGGTGFLGSHALPRLVSSGAMVYASYRGTSPPPANPGVHWIAGDLTTAAPTGAWPERCDAVIYLAQSRLWRRFPECATDVFDVNVQGVFRAAEYARLAGARRFIFVSTGSVYPPTDAPARESDAIVLAAHRHFYVAAKLSAELLLGAYAPHLRVIVLRLFVPYGPGQNAEMLIPQIVRKVREGEPVLLDGEDGLRTTPVAAADVAEAITRCTDLQTDGVFNLGGPDIVSLREISCEIGDVLGRAPRFEHRARPARLLAGNMTALRRTFGWAPATPFAEGLRAWLKDEGKGAP